MDMQVLINNRQLYNTQRWIGSPDPELSMGWQKLISRFLSKKETVATFGYLTKGEESAVLGSLRGLVKGSVRFMLKWSGYVYLISAVGETIYNIAFGGPTKTWEERVGVVVAHVLKASKPVVLAFAALEQAFFFVTENLSGGDPQVSLDLTASIDIWATPGRITRQVVPLAHNIDP